MGVGFRFGPFRLSSLPRGRDMACWSKRRGRPGTLGRETLACCQHSDPCGRSPPLAGDRTNSRTAGRFLTCLSKLSGRARREQRLARSELLEDEDQRDEGTAVSTHDFPASGTCQQGSRQLLGELGKYSTSEEPGEPGGLAGWQAGCPWRGHATPEASPGPWATKSRGGGPRTIKTRIF